MTKRIFLCRVDELAEGKMRQVALPEYDAEVAVYHAQGRFYATDDLCTHGMVSLTGGDLEGTKVYCPLHGGAFDICTGKATEKPCSIALRTYPVETDADGVWCLYET